MGVERIALGEVCQIVEEVEASGTSWVWVWYGKSKSLI